MQDLQKKIITVMEFCGWKRFERYYKKERYISIWFDEMNEILQEPFYHNNWEWLHQAWEKFRWLNFYFGTYEQTVLETKQRLIEECITRKSKEEAFNTLYDGIKWFNSLNTEK